jgi:hypothetical protein
VFQFCGADSPLSWHLTPGEIQRLTLEWQHARNQLEWRKMERFLASGSESDDQREPSLEGVRDPP